MLWQCGGLWDCLVVGKCWTVMLPSVIGRTIGTMLWLRIGCIQGVSRRHVVQGAVGWLVVVWTFTWWW